MKKYIALLFVLLLVYACSDGDDLGDVTMSKDYISVSQGLELDGDGGSGQIEIKATCNWTINTNASWLTISQTTGEGAETVTLSAERNSSGEIRTATLTVRGGTNISKSVTVTQGKATAQEPGRDDNIPPSTD